MLTCSTWNAHQATTLILQASAEPLLNHQKPLNPSTYKRTPRTTKKPPPPPHLNSHTLSGNRATAIMQLLNMRTLLLTLFTLLTLALAATQPQKSVIMTWSSDAPNSVVDQFKDAIVRAGGTITHEYKILKYVCVSYSLGGRC